MVLVKGVLSPHEVPLLNGLHKEVDSLQRDNRQIKRRKLNGRIECMVTDIGNLILYFRVLQVIVQKNPGIIGGRVANAIWFYAGASRPAPCIAL